MCVSRGRLAHALKKIEIDGAAIIDCDRNPKIAVAARAHYNGPQSLQDYIL